MNDPIATLLPGGKVPPQSALVDTRGAADFLNMSASWLEHDRQNKKPAIPFVRIGSRTVRYRINDLIDYAASRVTGLAA